MVQRRGQRRIPSPGSLSWYGSRGRSGRAPRRSAASLAGGAGFAIPAQYARAIQAVMGSRHRYRWTLGAVLAVVAALAVGVAVTHPSADPGGGGTGGAPTASLVPEGDRRPVPDFTGIRQWINSPPLHRDQLRGSVVLVDFWTFSCVNCTRTIPHLRALLDRYRDRGLVIVGVHSPEFDFEKDPANVAAAVRRLGVTWPVALDSAMATWNAYGNQYWPAEYLVDRQGRLAYVHAGEGEYAGTESAVLQLLGG